MGSPERDPEANTQLQGAYLGRDSRKHQLWNMIGYREEKEARTRYQASYLKLIIYFM